MIIKEILSQLENSDHPVAKALHKGENFKVLVIAFKKGMILKEHKANLPSKITVIEGNVVYKEGDAVVHLSKYDETPIPVHILHSVEAMADSICVLTQG